MTVHHSSNKFIVNAFVLSHFIGRRRLAWFDSNTTRPCRHRFGRSILYLDPKAPTLPKEPTLRFWLGDDLTIKK